MTNTDFQQMILKRIEHGQLSEPSEFQLIRNWSDYRYYSEKRRSFKIVVRGLLKGSNRLFKKYCQEITRGNDNINKLLAYQQIQKAINFYLQEIDTFTNMLNEYRGYLWNIR